MTRKERALKNLRQMRSDGRYLGSGSYAPSEVLEDFDFAIKALEQEQKTGHWEWVQYDYNPKIWDWHCSKCRSVVLECVSKEEKGGIPLYKYCPQCGRKMQEVSE